MRNNPDLVLDVLASGADEDDEEFDPDYPIQISRSKDTLIM